MARTNSSARRRQFIKGIGVGGATLLAGCTGGGDGGSGTGTTGGGSGDGGSGDGSSGGGGSGGGSASLKFVHTSSFSGAIGELGPQFDEQASNIEFSASGTPSESTTTRKYYVNQFVSQSSDFDLGMMDVIWPAEFVNNEWATKVQDPEGHTDAMLETPVEAATIDGELYGMPVFTDANALYYRKDLLDKYDYEAPKTYMELVNIAQDIMPKEDSINNGYIWQGGANEGLTIMWLNWLWGYGGSVQKDGKLKVNSEKGVMALQHAVDLIHEYGVTPESVPASGTDGNRQTFQQGGTLFMRNWPYAVSLMNSDDSAIKDKFAVAKMPKAEGHPNAENSCLGGWNIFVNAFSENPSAAQRFATYMASKPVQETLALEFSYLPVREDLYTDEYFEQAPNLETFAEVLQQTSARPSTPQYSTFSEIVYTECNKALVQNKSPQKALDDAQKQIDSEVNNA